MAEEIWCPAFGEWESRRAGEVQVRTCDGGYSILTCNYDGQWEGDPNACCRPLLDQAIPSRHGSLSGGRAVALHGARRHAQRLLPRGLHRLLAAVLQRGRRVGRSQSRELQYASRASPPF